MLLACSSVYVVQTVASAVIGLVLDLSLRVKFRIGAAV